MKKTAGVLLIIAVVMAVLNFATAEVVDFPGAPVVGIAWRADTDSEFFTNICRGGSGRHMGDAGPGMLGGAGL